MNTILNIKQAILLASGKEFEEYAVKSRLVELFYLRMIFAFHCLKHDIHVNDIAFLLKRDRTTVICSILKYKDEYLTSQKFRKLANDTEYYFNQIIEQQIRLKQAELRPETNDLLKSNTLCHSQSKVAINVLNSIL